MRIDCGARCMCALGVAVGIACLGNFAAAQRPKALRPVNPGRAAAKEYPVRTWTDASGKFKQEASYAGQDASGVQLKKSDGKVIQVRFDKLSKEDRAYLEGLAAAAGSDPENPFATAEEVRGGAENNRPAIWTSARQIAIQPVSGWSLTPDAAPDLPIPTTNKVAVLEGTGFDPRANRGKSGTENNFFESPERVLFDQANGQAVVVFINSPPGGGRRVRLSRCDMKTAKFVGEVAFSSETTPVDLSPTGSLVASLPERHGSDTKMIEIARLEGKSSKIVRRWNMGEWNDWSKQFEQLYFIGDDRLLTITSWGGVATLWDIDKAQALWTLSFAAHTTPALSAGRKQLALMTDSGLAILETASGDTLARIDTERVHGGMLAFSPDGKRLGRLSHRQVQVWDLTTGKLTHDVWFPKQMMGSSLDFLGGSYALVDKRFLIDLDKRIVLWEYELPPIKAGHVAALAGTKSWVVGGGRHAPYQLACLAVPDAAAKSKGDSLDAEGLLALKPGARVSLFINLPNAAEEDVQKAAKNLADRLKANGMVIENGAPLTLEASITDAGSETVKYSRFGFGHFGGGEEANVNKQISVLSLRENGKEIWAASGSYGAPGMVRQKSGQSIQDAVNEQKANPANFFANINLPTHIARHPEGGAYGKGQLKP